MKLSIHNISRAHLVEGFVDSLMAGLIIGLSAAAMIVALLMVFGSPCESATCKGTFSSRDSTVTAV